MYASAELHFGVLSRRWIPLLVAHLPAAVEAEPPASDRLLWRLSGRGWGNPAALLRGGDLDCLARPTIDGALVDSAPLTVAFDGQVLFHGLVDRAPDWRGAARAFGGVPVLFTTVAATAATDLAAAARDGLVVAAWARLFHRGCGVAHPVR